MQRGSLDGESDKRTFYHSVEFNLPKTFLFSSLGLLQQVNLCVIYLIVKIVRFLPV